MFLEDTRHEIRCCKRLLREEVLVCDCETPLPHLAREERNSLGLWYREQFRRKLSTGTRPIVRRDEQGSVEHNQTSENALVISVN